MGDCEQFSASLAELMILFIPNLSELTDHDFSRLIAELGSTFTKHDCAKLNFNLLAAILSR